MVRPIRTSSTCQARGWAKKGANHRAPKPKAQNHSKLALLAGYLGEIDRGTMLAEGEQTDRALAYCHAGLLDKYRSMELEPDGYFDQLRLWRLSPRVRRRMWC